MKYNSISKCGYEYFVHPHRALSMATGILSLLRVLHIYANLKQDKFPSKQITSLSVVSVSWFIGWLYFRTCLHYQCHFHWFHCQAHYFSQIHWQFEQFNTNLIHRTIRRYSWIICVRCIIRIILENAEKFFSVIPSRSHIIPQSASSNTAVLAGNMTTFSGAKFSNQRVSLHIQWANSSDK